MGMAPQVHAILSGPVLHQASGSSSSALRKGRDEFRKKNNFPMSRSVPSNFLVQSQHWEAQTHEMVDLEPAKRVETDPGEK